MDAPKTGVVLSVFSLECRSQDAETGTYGAETVMLSCITTNFAGSRWRACTPSLLLVKRLPMDGGGWREWTTHLQAGLCYK